MKIIGHRGARGLAPENTVLGIRVAMREKVDMIELDLWAQDGKIVLSHDPLVEGKKYTTLAQALKKVDSKLPLNLELKDPEVLRLLKKEMHGYKGEVVFSSFNYKILQIVKNIFPKSEIAVLEKWSGVRAVARASRLGTKRIHINHKALWSGFVKSMKHKDYKLYAYTVNLSDRAEELEKWGIDGIFTDYPNLFKDR